MSKKKIPVPLTPVASSTFTGDDIDTCNDKIRRAQMFTVLTLKTLEAEGLSTPADRDEDTGVDFILAKLPHVGLACRSQSTAAMPPVRRQQSGKGRVQ